MNFKNDFEESIYLIAHEIFGSKASVEHNKKIKIENGLFYDVASFSGPPQKEIDVISVNLGAAENISLLISCKDFTNSKAEPAHVQEWNSVINTMNKYSMGTKYIGMVICTSGFTSGCESWATSANIALIPSIKGITIEYRKDDIFKMVRRVLIGLNNRLNYPMESELKAPAFYDFCYSLTKNFEGYNTSELSNRYRLSDKLWMSSFGELVYSLKGKLISNIVSINKEIFLSIDDYYFIYKNNNEIHYGLKKNHFNDSSNELPICKRNFLSEDISFELLKQKVINKRITSAGDFNDYFEFGINEELNLGIFPKNLLNINEFNEHPSS